MATLKTSDYRNSTVLRIFSEKEFINTNPDYQRPGGIWSVPKKQLLIDSILNDYDIPKLYFNQTKDEKYEFAIIDGRQRLESIWEFINGDFTLSDEFVYFKDSNVNAKNLSYADLAREYPKLKINFDSYVLPIIIIETDEIELIEDMFSRLNEAVPLNAAEKRNSIGGSMTVSIRNVAENLFFKRKVKFSNSRYQHREVACRLLFLIYSLSNNNKVIDTKRPYLDKMTLFYKDNPNVSPDSTEKEVKSVLSSMNNIFINDDILLRSQSNITIYFLVFRNAIINDEVDKISRKNLLGFYESLAENRKVAEKDITEANYDYLEYERMSQQGTNDSVSIRERVRVLAEYLDLEKTTVPNKAPR